MLRQTEERLRLADEMEYHARTVRRLGKAFEVADLILERIPVCVTVGDHTGWCFVSRRFADLLGYDRDTLTATPYEDIIHPDDLERTAQVADMVYRGELPWGTVENRLRHRTDGEFIRLRWEWGPPNEADGLTVAVAHPVAIEGAP